MTLRARKTNRTTHSTSLTSSGGIPPLATVIPDWLIAQAKCDLTMDRLWDEGRGSYRETLTRLVRRFTNAGGLTEEDLGKVFRIVYYNDEYRERTYSPPPPALRAVAPPPVDDMEPIDPEELELDTVAPEEGDRLSLADLPGGDDIPHFNPPLPAAYIAQGWGFAHGGSLVQRFVRDFADFPKPIDGGDRKTLLWRYSDVRAWTNQHGEAIQQARRRGIRQRESRTQSTEMADLRAENAQLRAQLAERGTA